MSKEYSRVPDINTARRNIAKQRDEKQIQLMQEALRRENVTDPGVNFKGNAEAKPNPVKVRAELFKVLSEIAERGITPNNPINREQIAEEIHNKVGYLFYDELNLRNLLIPSKRTLKALESNPNFDPNSLQILAGANQFTHEYNRLLRGYHFGGDWKNIGTVGDYQKLNQGNRHVLFVNRAFTPQK
jgi:hypothetical protein